MAALESDIADLEARLADELDALEEKYAAHAEELEETLVRASASDIAVELLALAWVPGCS